MTTITQYYRWLRSTRNEPTARDAALLAARVILAWLFIYHGGATLFGWFNGPGAHNAGKFFADVAHLHPGVFFASVAGATELFGSIFVLIGLFGRISALVIAGDMAIAMATVTFKNGISSNAVGGGYELNLALAGLALVVAILGTGRASLDYAIRNRRTG